MANRDTENERPEDEELDDFELTDEIAARWDPDKLMSLVSERAGKSEALDYNTRSRMEGFIGERQGNRPDFGKVRLITGEFATEMTKRHNAAALTVGDTGMILMRGGAAKAEWSGATGAKDRLLAHELTHVAQAQDGLHARDVGGNFGADRAALESQAYANEAAFEEDAAQEASEDAAQQRQQIIDRAVEILFEEEARNLRRRGRLR